jgi:hypothetical protein
MTVAKFLAIIGKVTRAVAFDPDARLTFEVSDGAAPMQLFGAATIRVAERELRVALANRPASCKPRDRWLDAPEQASACCGPKAHSTESDQKGASCCG